MRLDKLWRQDQNWFWMISFLWFLLLELALRIKLGVIFGLAVGWFLILQWQAGNLLGMRFSRNRIRLFLQSLYYAFLVSLLIFLVFFALNGLVRSFDNSIRFFQLP
jgi:hypothetical protein